VTDNDRFFSRTLPGRREPMSSPHDVAKLGAVGADTDLVASYQMPAPQERARSASRFVHSWTFIPLGQENGAIGSTLPGPERDGAPFDRARRC
jgi:hypothetical protein